MCILRPLLAVTLPLALTAGLIVLAQQYGRAPIVVIGRAPSQPSETQSAIADDSKPDPQHPHTHGISGNGAGGALVGRFLKENGDSYLFEWPLSTIRARFQGSELSLKLEDVSSSGEIMYQVLVDGHEETVLRTKKVEKVHLVASGLAFTTHDIEVIRRTEAHIGTARFSGFELGTGRLLEPPQPRDRRVLFIGDSITAGYGVLCNVSEAPFTAETESAYHTYAAVAARALDADAHVIAYSGKGVYRNHPAAIKEPPMSALFDAMLPQHNPDERVDLTSWRPHAVVINLATNDYNPDHETPVDPGAFVAAYQGMLKTLRLKFGEGVPIILCLGSMLNDTWPTEETKSLSRARTAIRAVIEGLKDEKRLRFLEFPNQDTYDVGRGCSGHPNEEVHRQMAEILEAFLRRELAWTRPSAL